MRFLAILLLLGSVSCSLFQTSDETPPWDAPSSAGPVLIGVVRGPDGAPLEGIRVATHGGFATRWLLEETVTDAEGRYRFDPVEGSYIQGADPERWDLYVGVCAGSVSSGNPAELLPWEDVQLANAPGVVERVDFELDPADRPPGSGAD